MELPSSDASTSRGRFLKQIGTAVALGLGVSMFGAKNAYAINGKCCPPPDPAGLNCPAGEWWCTDGNGVYCCAGATYSGSCFFARAPLC